MSVTFFYKLGLGSGSPAIGSGRLARVLLARGLEASQRFLRPAIGSGGQPEGLEASQRVWEASQRVWEACLRVWEASLKVWEAIQ